MTGSQDTLQKVLAKNTHYQDVNIEGLNPPFFMRLPTMQDRNPLKNKKIWSYDIEVEYSSS